MAPVRTTPVYEPGRQLIVLPWVDPTGGTAGHDPRSEYVERFWVGILGPTAVLLLRRLAEGFEHFPDGFEIDVAEMAGALGVGGAGRQSPFSRTVNRCAQFGLVRAEGPGLLVRRRMPTLTARQLARLPPALGASHDTFCRATRLQTAS